jgi:hypothetical protein
MSETAVAEQPKKSKKGNKDNTTVETAKVPREGAKAVGKASTFRILDGVDAAKFRGQRQHVVNALKKLGEGNPNASFTIAQIAENCNDLVTKTPIDASIKYHLGFLVKDKEVQEIGAEPAAPEAEKAAA